MSICETLFPKEIIIQISKHLCYVDKINFLYRTFRIYPDDYTLPIDKKIIKYNYRNTELLYNKFKQIVSIDKLHRDNILQKELDIPSSIIKYKNIKVLVLHQDVRELNITKKMRSVIMKGKHNFVRYISLDKKHNLEYLEIRIDTQWAGLDENFLKIKNIKLSYNSFEIHIINREIIKLDMKKYCTVSLDKAKHQLLSFLKKIGINNLYDRKINTFCSENPISYSNIIRFSNIRTLIIGDFEFAHFAILNSNDCNNITELKLCLDSNNIDILDFSKNKNIKKLTINCKNNSKPNCLINESLEYLHLTNICIDLKQIKSHFNLNTLSLINCIVTDTILDNIIIPKQIKSLTFVADDLRKIYKLEVPTELDYLEFDNVSFSNDIKYIRKCNFRNFYKLNCEQIDIIEISHLKDSFEVTSIGIFLIEKPSSFQKTTFDFSIYNCDTFILQNGYSSDMNPYKFNFKLPHIMKCVDINLYSDLILENVCKIELLILAGFLYNEYRDLKKISDNILIKNSLYK